jgi:hypothetical protein
LLCRNFLEILQYNYSVNSSSILNEINERLVSKDKINDSQLLKLFEEGFFNQNFHLLNKCIDFGIITRCENFENILFRCLENANKIKFHDNQSIYDIVERIFLNDHFKGNLTQAIYLKFMGLVPNNWNNALKYIKLLKNIGFDFIQQQDRNENTIIHAIICACQADQMWNEKPVKVLSFSVLFYVLKQVKIYRF